MKLTYPGTEYTADKTVDVWWYDGGEKPPDSLLEPVGARFPNRAASSSAPTGCSSCRT